jgi:hypothetical protein
MTVAAAGYMRISDGTMGAPFTSQANTGDTL